MKNKSLRLQHFYGLSFILAAVLTLLLLAGTAYGRDRYQLLKSFGFPALETGSSPYNQVILGSDGMLYGTTIRGGSNNLGAVFRVSTNGSNYQMLHAFTGSPDGSFPESELLLGSDGLLYGTTYGGGTNSDGTIYRLAPDGTGYKVLHHLADAEGRSPAAGLIEGREDGFLYGVGAVGGAGGYFGAGTVFKLAKDGSSFAVVCNMTQDTGEGPSATLLEASDGLLYGMTFADGRVGGPTGNGTVFRVSRNGGTPQSIYSFQRNNTDGANITGHLIQGPDNLLYGVSRQGGNINPGQFAYLGCGTIFRLTTSGGSYQQIFLFPTTAQDGFTPNGALLLGKDGRLYGTTSIGGAYGEGTPGGTPGSGTVYALNRDGSGFTVIHSLTNNEGNTSLGGLVQGADGKLFGTCSAGGDTGKGTVFSVTTNGATTTVLHQFAGVDGGDGTSPADSLAIAGKIAYGTTSGGTVSGRGEVYSIHLDGSGYTQLHPFTNGTSDGGTTAGVIVGADGNLYGTLPYAGIYQGGTVFKLGTNGTYSTLHDFGGVADDGANPTSGLMQGADGFLYGVTSGGGTNYAGTVFRLSTNGLTYSVLWQFDGGNGGYNPVGNLVQGTDGLLYGVTAYGSVNGGGLIFRMSTNGSSFTILRSLPGSDTDANQPQAGLLIGKDGMLYGTSQYGGTNFSGTVFRLNVNGSSEQVIYDFMGTTDGVNPTMPLIQGTNGVLYGVTASGGTNSGGVVFSLNPDGSGYLNQHVFLGADGLNPSGGVKMGPDGLLYGPAQNGAASGFGGIFSLGGGATALLPQITSGSVTVNFTGGLPGQTYGVYVSTNLLSWGLLGNATADIGGNFQITDPIGAGKLPRFYRSFGP